MRVPAVSSLLNLLSFKVSWFEILAAIVWLASITVILFSCDTSSKEPTDEEIYSAIAEDVFSILPGLPPGSRIAMLPLVELGKKETHLSKHLSEVVLAAMLEYPGIGLRVVERDYSEDIIREQSRAVSGIADARTSPRLGEILAPEIIVVGTTFASDSNLFYSLRSVDIETEEVLYSTSGSIRANKTYQDLAALDKSEPFSAWELRSWIAEHYQWLWAAILAPVAAWLWQRYQERRGMRDGK